MKIVAWYRKWKLRKSLKVTKIGIREGIPIEAVTDAMGPQVLVGGDKHAMYRLSPVQVSHRQAVKLGRRVFKEGFQVCDKTWANLKAESTGEAMFRVFGGIAARDQGRL